PGAAGTDRQWIDEGPGPDTLCIRDRRGQLVQRGREDPVKPENAVTAEASVRASAWALATRARACTFMYSGNEIAARIPMMATTSSNSTSVKPRRSPSFLERAWLCMEFALPFDGPGRDRLRNFSTVTAESMPPRPQGDVPFPAIAGRGAGVKL